MEILAHKPVGLEGIDGRLIDDMKKKGLHPRDVALLPPGGGWLMVEFGAERKQEADDQARALMAALAQAPDRPEMKLFTDRREEAMVWTVRESALGATSLVPGEGFMWPGWEDSAVPPDKMGAYLRDLRALLDRCGYACGFYGHFGQGCLHTRIDFDLVTREGIASFRSFMEDAARLVVHYGGSLSGEHGDGQARAELLPLMYGDELVKAFAEFKAIWDPDDKLNPGKMANPYRLDENLRLGTSYNPPPVRTHFQFPADEGSFANATLRCAGVGLCRRLGGGTMCPSFMVTREERDTTRGRARLLFEMLKQDPLPGLWRDEAVRESLDLCLACKGCKGDCPVNVDMATYKAEFLAHYFAGRPRPLTGYSMGLIHWWARLASLAPWAANFATHAPLLRTVAKTAAGVAPEREMPTFAPLTFRAWFERRPPRNVGWPEVILWPDCFNNHFHPATAAAAVAVLEAAGFQVKIPARILCCGRPLYDYGWLDQAKRLLRQVLAALGPEIRAGTPVVGLEPSCVAVFRDELLGLFPHDEDAKRLSQQSSLLSEFLVKKVADYRPPPLHRQAVVHGHCHHKAIMHMDDEEEILRRLGLGSTTLDSGCCGMAGAFGFEKAHYQVSQAAGERVLLPAVRRAPKDALIIADGFSCREQIAQGTDRRALHLAQVLQMALREGPAGPAGEYPESDYQRLPGGVPADLLARQVATVGAPAALAGAALWALWRRWR